MKKHLLMSGALLPICWIMSVPCGAFLGHIYGSKIGAALGAARLANLKNTFLTKAKAHTGPAFQIVGPNNRMLISVPHISNNVESNRMIPYVSMDSAANAKHLIGRFHNNPEDRALIQRTHNLDLNTLPATFSKFTLRSFEGTYYSVQDAGPPMAALTVDEMVRTAYSNERNREKVGGQIGLAAGIVLGFGLPFPAVLYILGA